MIIERYCLAFAIFRFISIFSWIPPNAHQGCPFITARLLYHMLSDLLSIREKKENKEKGSP